MPQQVRGERITGLVLMVAGVGFAWYALEHYALGTPRRMGPGMFPVGLGLVLAALGLAIAIVSPDRALRRPDFDLRISAAVVGAIVIFGLLVSSLGLLPAVAGTVVVAALAERPFRPISVIALSAVLGTMAWLIFRVGLGLPMPMLRWPY